MESFEDVLNFWFTEITPKQWWVKDIDFDKHLAERYSALHEAATKGELFAWREHELGRLGEVIVLDQFPRNIYRDDARAFASDPMALVLSQQAVQLQTQVDFSVEQKMFLYLPFMHSESLMIHDEAVKLFSEPGLENNLDFEHRHKRIVERFGRYPHRNAIVGRQSTEEEMVFLKEPGSSF